MNTKPSVTHRSHFHRFLAVILSLLLLFSVGPRTAARAGSQIDIPGPEDSGAFGQVTWLPNGNLVVVDSSYSSGIGAVYLYDGSTGAMISSLTGSVSGDQAGSGGIWVLSNGNFVVTSPYWHNGTLQDAGAATWVDGMTGLNGVISESNSLVGPVTGSMVGIDGVVEVGNGNYVILSSSWMLGATSWTGAATWVNGTTGIHGLLSTENSLVGTSVRDPVHISIYPLSNGNYVVDTPNWDNGSTFEVGAVTWANGATGIAGVISPSNSLIGVHAEDYVGDGGIFEVGNGNYVVKSPRWHNGAVAWAGAVTWCNGASATTGQVSSSNSLTGTRQDDIANMMVLANGNYIVASPLWDNGPIVNVGAVTWGSGMSGITGPISASNSLIGAQANDMVGLYPIRLTNGNYVIHSPRWDDGLVADVGAVTWVDGSGPVSGVVSAANSLTGSTSGDMLDQQVWGYVTGLSDGNFMVTSPGWDNGPTRDVGAVTWVNGQTGIAGPISPANSLVGSQAGDKIGNGPFPGYTELTNGNIVVSSPSWDNGSITDAGAVTWMSKSSPFIGQVTAANSLVGTHADDQVGINGIITLTNGNYVVSSPYWDNDAAVDAGAVTWVNGSAGFSGVVSAANSLVGSQDYDQVGHAETVALSNGDYVVSSPEWDNGLIYDPGAVTWGSGAAGVSGPVSLTNSLIGSQISDQVGSWEVIDLGDGNYLVTSSYWDQGAVIDSGAVTFLNAAICGTGETSGVISSSNSILGAAEYGGQTINIDYDPLRHRLAVARPADNIVSLRTIIGCNVRLFLPLIQR